MSVPVDLDALASFVRELGPETLLVTVTPDGRPHIVSVVAACNGERIECGAGRRTLANLESNLSVTLIWPTVRDGAYRLIVDGTAALGTDLDAARISITPTFAVLHRISTAPDDGPTCVAIEA
jgi:hypothetical protein